MNRRDFLHAGCTIAAASFIPSAIDKAEAHFMRGGFVASGGGGGFNGGKSQGLTNYSGNTSLDFPFINLLKMTTGWTGNDTTNNGAPIDPSWLGTDGYPINIGTGGVSLGANIPQYSTWSANSLGNLVLMWDVTGAGASDTWALQIGNFATTPVSGSLTGTGNGSSFSYVFNPQSGLANGQTSFFVNIITLGGTSHITNMRLCFAGNQTAMLAGEMFNPQFKSVLKTLGFGVFRFLDWLSSSVCNVTTWASRKAVAYPTWFGEEFRASLYPGDMMTDSGNGLTYQLSTTSTPYIWPGFTNGNPVDKQTMHVHWSSDAVLVQASEPGGTLSVSGLGSSNTILFTWNSHPLANGEVVSLNNGNTGGSPLNGTNGAVNYYVINATTNTFQLAKTPGGSAISTPDTSTNNNNYVTRMPTLELNGTGNLFPVRNLDGTAFIVSNQLPKSTSNGTVKLYATLVFDVTYQSWLAWGGSSASGSGGIRSAVPPEICLQLCIEMGMHPHFSVPHLTLDTFTDYVPSLDAYVQANAPAWMIPHYEPSNEVWNLDTAATELAVGKAFLYWGTQFDFDNWYGMALSIFGQALKTSRGGVAPGTTYEVLCGMSTDGGGRPLATPNPRTSSTLWVSNNSPVRPPYTIQAASLTASAGLIANYVSPGFRGAIPELQLAWEYYFGTLPGQVSTLNTYADSFGNGVSGSSILTINSGTAGVVNWPNHGRLVGDNIQLSTTGTLPSGAQSGYVQSVIDSDHLTISSSLVNGVPGSAQIWSGTQSGTQFACMGPFTNNYENARYQNWNTFFISVGFGKTFAYEGGYSPDLLQSYQNWTSPISGSISKGYPTVITLASTNTPDGPTQCAGTPAQVGMALGVQNVGGMTQLNCLGGQGVVVTNGSATIPWSGNILVAGQVVTFQLNGNIPSTNLTAGQPYYVLSTNLSTSSFEISATKGGSPIAITVTGGGTTTTNLTVDSGWAVLSVSGNNVSLDVDGTSFGSYTSGGVVTYNESASLINQFRMAVLQSAPDLQTQLRANYDNYTAAGGLYPSQFGISLLGYGLGGQTAWNAIEGDIWQPLNQEGQMIQAYN